MCVYMRVCVYIYIYIYTSVCVHRETQQRKKKVSAETKYNCKTEIYRQETEEITSVTYPN